MRYVNTTTLEPLEYADIKKQYNEVSIPADGAESIAVGEDEYALLTLTAKPSFAFVIKEGTPTLSNGIYTQTWETRPFTAEELLVIEKAKVPQQITPRQCRLQLLALGLLDEVETCVVSIVRCRYGLSTA